jgi:hypothetical protein
MIVICPHCKENVIIEKLNCSIFRHGVFIRNNKQINPHLSKSACDLLIRKKMIYGCSKPFQVIINDENNYEAIICDYV